MIGWYAKEKIKNYLIILILCLILWFFFLYKSDGFNTAWCEKDNCIVKTAQGPMSKGGTCVGDLCIAGNCIGEECTAGDCKGKKCKAGDCYGIGCSPGKCVDPNCTNEQNEKKECIIDCTPGVPYSIKRNKFYNYTKYLVKGSFFNKNYCNNEITADCVTPNCIKCNCNNKINSNLIKLNKVKYYLSGWKDPSWSYQNKLQKDVEEGKPVITDVNPIIKTDPRIFKGPNCQWCIKNDNNNIVCSDYIPSYEKNVWIWKQK